MNMKNFKTILKGYRLDQKLKQSDVAKVVGVTQQCISEWENGKTEPTLSYLWKIADYFDISVDELIGRKKY